MPRRAGPDSHDVTAMTVNDIRHLLAEIRRGTKDPYTLLSNKQIAGEFASLYIRMHAHKRCPHRKKGTKPTVADLSSARLPSLVSPDPTPPSCGDGAPRL